jgi:hypothetical protein
MAVIDSIRTMFTADTSDLERGAKKAQSVFKTLNDQFGKGTSAGQFFTLLKGGGAVAGLTLASRVFSDVTNAVREATSQQGSFNEKLEVFAGKLPIVGNFIRGIDELGEAITGATARQDELNAAISAGNAAIQKSQAFRESIREKPDKVTQEITKIRDAATERRLELTRALQALDGKEAPTIPTFTLTESAMHKDIAAVNTYYQERVRLSKELIENERAEAEAIKRIREDAAASTRLDRFHTLRELENMVEQFAKSAAPYTDMVNEALGRGVDGSEAHALGQMAEAIAKRQEALKNIADDDKAYQQLLERIAGHARDRIMTDVDRARQLIDEARLAVDAGKLLESEFSAYAEKLATDLAPQLPRLDSKGITTAAHLAGSQEAFAASAQSEADKRAADIAKSHKAVSDKMLNELRQIRQGLRSRPDLVVDIP